MIQKSRGGSNVPAARARGSFMFILCRAAKNEAIKIAFGKPKAQVCLLAFANKQALQRQRGSSTQTATAKVLATYYAPDFVRIPNKNGAARSSMRVRLRTKPKILPIPCLKLFFPLQFPHIFAIMKPTKSPSAPARCGKDKT